jgi:type II secretory pathway component PulM
VSELWSRVQTLWDGFSPREKGLVGAVGGMLVASLLMFAVVNPILDATDRARERVETAELQLETMKRLRRDYEAIEARLHGVEERIRANRDRQHTLTLLESLASTAAVKIDSMEERKSPDHALYRVTRVDVELKKVTLTQVVTFLHGIESSPRQFSVKGLRIKTRPDLNDLLDVSFAVSSFEVI